MEIDKNLLRFISINFGLIKHLDFLMPSLHAMKPVALLVTRRLGHIYPSSSYMYAVLKPGRPSGS